MKKKITKKKPTKSTSLKVIKKPLNLPKITSHSHTKCPKSKKNTPSYYHCLAAQACQGKNITKACTYCKKNASALANSRQKEISNLKKAFEQIGISLTKLVPR